MPPKRSKQTEPTPLGRKMTLYRKKKGLTMQQLAAEVGVTESYISFLESGERTPSRKLIKKLIGFFYPQGNPVMQDEWLMLAGFSPENPQQHVQAADPLESFEEKLSHDQSDLKTQFAFIRSLIKSGEHERAKRQIQQCFQLFDGTVEVQSLVGSLELAKGNFDSAILAQETALAFYHQQPEAPSPTRLGLTDLLLSLGVSSFLKGYYYLTVYHQAETQQRKKEGRALRDLAKSCFEAARERFGQALEADGDDIYIWDEYARVSFNLAHLANGETNGTRAELWQETISAYRRVLKHRDNRVMGSEALLETALFLGHAYTKSGEFAAAEDILSLIQAVRPEYWLAHYARACLLSLQAEQQPEETLLDDALEHLTRAIQLDTGGSRARDEARSDPDLKALRDGRQAAFSHLVGKGNGKSP